VTIRVGLIGLEAHANYVLKGIDESRSLRLVAAARLGAPGPAFAAERGVRLYDDHRELLEHEKVDVLAVFLVPSDQGVVVVDALRAGISVMTDKPLATDDETLRAIEIEHRHRSNVEVGMLLTARGTPTFAAMRELVQTSTIGVPALAYAKHGVQLRRGTRASWYFDRRLFGGPMLDLAVHNVDFLSWATGVPYRRVTAIERNAGSPDDPYLDDSGAALFEMETGFPAIVEYHRLLQEPFVGMDVRAKVVGTRGQAEIHWPDRLSLVTETVKREITHLPAPVNVFVDFAESVTSGRRPLVDTPSVLQTMRALLAARESARSGRTMAIARQ
jgi:predicted dehydrogenase